MALGVSVCAVSVLLATRPSALRTACSALVHAAEFLRSAFPPQACNPREAHRPCASSAPMSAMGGDGLSEVRSPSPMFRASNPCSTLARRPKAACCGDYPQALLFRVTGRCTVPEWTQQSLDRVGSHGQPPCSRRRGRSTVGGLLKTRCHRYELVGDSRQPFTSSWPAGLCIPAEGAAGASMRAIQKFALCRFRAQCQRVTLWCMTQESAIVSQYTRSVLSL